MLLRNKRQNGFSLIEMLVYTAILAFVIIFVFFSVTFIGRSYKILKSERAFTVSATSAMDRIVREVRKAGLLDDSASTYGVNPGEFVLQPGNIRFFVENGVLKIQEGAGAPGALTFPDVSVIDFTVRKITTPHSEALKVEMGLRSVVGETEREKRFFDTAVLRGSY